MDGEAQEKALANIDHHFLVGAMAHWEACLSFIVDQPKSVLHYLYPFCRPSETTYIHMFTGISLPLLVTLARVGICVRQNRALRTMAGLGWKDRKGYRLLASEVEQDATELAELAVNYKTPADTSFDKKDLGASTYSQLKAFAQMCKFAIMLELQRNFPKLMNPQLNNAEVTSPEANKFATAFNLDRSIHELSGAVLIHAQEIPEGSTCGLYQSLLLVICGSVLRPSKTSKTLLSEQSSLHERMEAQILSTLARPEELDKRRAFIRRRLQSNSSKFGLRQVYSRAELLLENIWSEFDAGTGADDDTWSSCHWIDAMADHKLETFFG